MELGEQVVFFTHESSDLTSRSVDELAFCTGVVDDHTIDVVIFPPGGPVRFARVSDFGRLDVPPGSSYFRAKGSDAPDFKAYDDYQALLLRQRNELSQVKPAERDELLREQEAERQAALGKGDHVSDPPPPPPMPRPAALRGATE